MNNINGNINAKLIAEWNNDSESKSICTAVSGQRLINDFLKPKDQGGMGLRKVNWYTDGGTWESVPGPPPFENIEHPEYRCYENTTTGLCFNRYASKLSINELSDMLNLTNGTNGFQWNEDDFETVKWRPQGITTERFSNNHSKDTIVISWYNRICTLSDGICDKNKVIVNDIATRLTFIKYDAGTNKHTYAHVLLVEPKTDEYKDFVNDIENLPSLNPDYDGALFNDVFSHSGGIAWIGDYIYVAETQSGLRVFDIKDIFKVENVDDPSAHSGYIKNRKIGLFKENGVTKVYARNYNYILPQKFFYKNLRRHALYGKNASDTVLSNFKGDNPDYLSPAGNFSYGSEGDWGGTKTLTFGNWIEKSLRFSFNTTLLTYFILDNNLIDYYASSNVYRLKKEFPTENQVWGAN